MSPAQVVFFALSSRQFHQTFGLFLSGFVTLWSTLSRVSLAGGVSRPGIGAVVVLTRLSNHTIIKGAYGGHRQFEYYSQVRFWTSSRTYRTKEWMHCECCVQPINKYPFSIGYYAFPLMRTTNSTVSWKWSCDFLTFIAPWGIDLGPSHCVVTNQHAYSYRRSQDCEV